MRNENGIVLFLVLWVLVLLSVIVGEFGHAMRTEVNIARNFGDEAKAYHIAQAGIWQAIFGLVESETKPPAIGTVEFDKKEETTKWRINADIPAVEFADGQFVVRIENESGKADLNAADENLLKILLIPFQPDAHQRDIITDSILDWRDEDDFHRPNGAENEYYQSLPEPYPCKNANFDSVEELLLVRGMTREIFHGGLENMLTTDRGEAYQDRNPVFGTSEYAKMDEKRKININAASPEFLRLFPVITEDVIRNITQYRKTKDFETDAEIAAVLGVGVQAALAPYITVKKSPFFTITSVGMVRDSSVRQGIRVLVEIDPMLDKKFRIVQWSDRYDISKQSRN